MREVGRKRLDAAFLILLSLAIVWLVGYAVNGARDTLRPERIERLGFEGTFTQSGAREARPLTQLGQCHAPELTLTGHFDRDIPAGTTVMIPAQVTRLEGFRDGAAAYAIEPDAQGRLDASFDSAWARFTSPGILPGDRVEIRLNGGGARQPWYGRFLDRLYAGDPDALLRLMLRANAWQLACGGIILIFGAAFCMTQVVLSKTGLQVQGSYFACGFLQICGAICTLIDYDYITFLFSNANFINALDYVTQTLIADCLLIYLRSFCVKARSRNMVTAFIYLFTLSIVFYAAVYAFSIVDTQSYIGAQIISAIAMIVATLIALLREKRAPGDRKIWLLLVSGALLAACVLAEMLNYLISCAYWIGVFQAGLLCFSVMQFAVIMMDTRENYQRLRAGEAAQRKNLQSRMAIMLSQIQPHFLYNALAGIGALCEKDPKEASSAIDHFAFFLRGNLDSLKAERPIPFSSEMRHVENYLYIEKMRFGRRLNVQYDVAYQDFTLPTLTLQPIVENAVRYGVTQRPEGGTLWIASGRQDGCAVVTVRDDGVGFDAYQPHPDGRTHIGIDNVRERLKEMCEGTLVIRSAPGEGTLAIITIPLKEENA